MYNSAPKTNIGKIKIFDNYIGGISTNIKNKSEKKNVHFVDIFSNIYYELNKLSKFEFPIKSKSNSNLIEYFGRLENYIINLHDSLEELTLRQLAFEDFLNVSLIKIKDTGRYSVIDHNTINRIKGNKIKGILRNHVNFSNLNVKSNEINKKPQKNNIYVVNESNKINYRSLNKDKENIQNDIINLSDSENGNNDRDDDDEYSNKKKLRRPNNFNKNISDSNDDDGSESSNKNSDNYEKIDKNEHSESDSNDNSGDNHKIIKKIYDYGQKYFNKNIYIFRLSKYELNELYNIIRENFNYEGIKLEIYEENQLLEPYRLNADEILLKVSYTKPRKILVKKIETFNLINKSPKSTDKILEYIKNNCTLVKEI